LAGFLGQQRAYCKGSCKKPEIIFLDEPTSGVDQESREQFFKILKKLNSELGITLVLVSHDVDVIAKEITEIMALNRSLIFYGKVKEFIHEEKGIKFIKNA
jgi:zinc transport system ATP-binding protein